MCDGTWRKRGISSLQELSLQFQQKLANALTMKPLAKVAMVVQNGENARLASKAQMVDRAYLRHKLCWVCPAMEPEGIVRIFQRPESDKCLHFAGYIGDGDSKS